MHIQLRNRIVILAVLLPICLGGCGKTTVDTRFARPAQTDSQTAQADDQQDILQAQAQQARKVEVTVGGRVAKMLPDDTRGLPHERFLLQLDNGTRVLVAHDTKLAPRVPLNDGDFVRIHGEYIWNERGGVLHWTHHTPNGRHEPGWIDFNGQRYE